MVCKTQGLYVREHATQGIFGLLLGGQGRQTTVRLAFQETLFRILTQLSKLPTAMN